MCVNESARTCVRALKGENVTPCTCVHECVRVMRELACKRDMYVSSERVHLIQSCVCASSA